MKSLNPLRTALLLIAVCAGIATQAQAQVSLPSNKVGIFNGLVTPSSPATDIQENRGIMNLVVSTNGGFSGKLTTNTTSFIMKGVFVGGTAFVTPPPASGIGTAWNLTLNTTVTPSTLTGTITDYRAGGSVAVMNINAVQTYSSQADAPGALAVVYNIALTPPTPVGTLAAGQYPTGNGVGTLTITPSIGKAVLALKLPDGTVAKGVTFMCRDGSIPIFAAFPFGIGSVSALVTINTGAPSTDLTATGVKWFRSPNSSQYYNAGFGEGLTCDLVGTMQSSSTLASLGFSASLINAQMTVTNPLFDSSPVVKNMNVSTAGVGKNTLDKSFSVTITPAVVKGKLGETSGAYLLNGAIIGKGGSGLIYGHVISAAPKHTDGSGKGGSLTILPFP